MTIFTAFYASFYVFQCETVHPVNKINCLIQLAWNNSLSRLLSCYNENENKCLTVLFVENGSPSGLINTRFKQNMDMCRMNSLATLTKETAFNEAYFSFHLFIYLFGWLGALEAKGTSRNFKELI